eukprot:5707730-Amphidinium_carterae.1
MLMVALALLAGYALRCRHQSSDGCYWDRTHVVFIMMHGSNDSEWQSYVWRFGGQWWWWQALFKFVDT